MAARSVVMSTLASSKLLNAFDALKESVRAFFPLKASCHTSPVSPITPHTRPDASTDTNGENASVPHLSGAVVVASVGLGHTSSSNLGRHQQFLRLLHVAYPSPSTLFPVPVLNNVEVAFDLTIDEDRPRLNATRSTARLSSTSSDTNDAEQPRTVVSVGGNVAPSSPRLSGQSSSSSDSDPPFECFTPALATDVQLHNEGKVAASQAPLLLDVPSPTNGSSSMHAHNVAPQEHTPFVCDFYDGQDDQESSAEPLIADATDGQNGDAVLQAEDEDTANEAAHDRESDADSGDEATAGEAVEPLDGVFDSDSYTDDEPQGPLIFTSPYTGTRYTVKGVIGSGGFGRVSEVTTDEKQRFAVKVIHKREAYKSMPVTRELLLHEKKIMAAIAYARCPGMMGLFESWEDKDNVYFVMELCRTNLYTYIASKAKWVKDDPSRTEWDWDDMDVEEKFYCAEMLASVRRLHGVKIVHRDIKPENILLDRHGRCMIADFGLALRGSADRPVEEVVSTHVVGTHEYFAPEQHVPDLEHGYKVDIWQLGCVWIELLGGLEKSWNESCGFEWNYETFQEPGIREKLRQSVIELLDGHPALELLLWMTELDPANRPTAAQIMNHPWFAGTIKWKILFDEPGVSQHEHWFLPEYNAPGAASPRHSTFEATRLSNMMIQKKRSPEEEYVRSYTEEQLKMYDVDPHAFAWALPPP